MFNLSPADVTTANVIHCCLRMVVIDLRCLGKEVGKIGGQRSCLTNIIAWSSNLIEFGCHSLDYVITNKS